MRSIPGALRQAPSAVSMKPGVDPLAGPVVAALVVLDPRQHIPGVRDSKQLSARRRAELAHEIKASAAAWSVAAASVAEIDALNILHATFLAMRRSVEQLEQLPDSLQVDGNRAPELPGYAGNLTTLIGGDRLCPAISAASILAKVARDEQMLELDRQFPEYGFARHKGYPTARHREALQRFGPCSAHRRSYAPVRRVLNDGTVSA